MTTKTRMKYDQLRKKSAALNKELIGVQGKIITKRRELGDLILNRGEGRGVGITGLQTALSELQDQAGGLQAAIEAGRSALEESHIQVNQEDYRADLAEIRTIDKRLNEAALVYIRRSYADRDDFDELSGLHVRAKALSKKHGDKISTMNITKSGQVIGAVRRTVVPVSRAIEIFAGDLVEQAGERRRF